MEQINKIVLMLMLGILFSSFVQQNGKEVYSLNVNVSDLRNSDGVVQFTLYNKEGSIPDKKYYKQLKNEIIDNVSTITFKNIPKGVYAINILHDENEDGEIDKGLVLPVEGIGFSNLRSISPFNQPSFKKAKFELTLDKTISVTIIYL